jgi:predicted nucleotide-binding protein
MRSAVRDLQSRIDELNHFDLNTVESGSNPAVKRLEARIEQTVARHFGPDSHEYNQLKRGGAWKLDRTVYVLNMRGGPPTSPNKIRQGLETGRQTVTTLLEEQARSLTETLEHLAPQLDDPTSGPPPHVNRQVTNGDDVFIVHGHDKQAKTEVQLFLERAGLHPVVLHEQPNAGKTIIEKFEDHAGVAAFAVVLMTPDDIGGPVPFAENSLRPRARQNVVLELGWFAGKLGRSRVCALKKGDIEIPSDIAGVVYIDMDDRGAWRSELLKELGNAGYKPDWPRAMV